MVILNKKMKHLKLKNVVSKFKIYQMIHSIVKRPRLKKRDNEDEREENQLFQCLPPFPIYIYINDFVSINLFLK